MTLLAGFSMIGIMIVVMAIIVKAFQCKHAWEFVDKTELPSRIEEARKHSVNLGNFWTAQVQDMLERKVIIVLRCPKCGNAKILRESN
jgi:hypothetical protein